MTGSKVKAVMEVLCNKPQAVYLITMSAGSYQVKCIFEAGKISGVLGPDFPGHQSVSSCSDESWIVVPESFCPVGLEVSMKVAGETVGDPSGLSVCIDIEHPWKDYFPIIGRVLEYMGTDLLIEPERRSPGWKSVMEVLCKKPQAVYKITMSSGSYQVVYIIKAGEAGEITKVVRCDGGPDLFRRAVLSCSDESWIVVPESFCPLGLEVSMKVAGETVGDPSGLSVCIDIEHPWKDYFPIIGQVLEYMGKEILFGSRGTNGYRLAVKKLEEEELRGTNGYLFPDVVTEDPASLQPGIRDLWPVVNADTATEARLGALGLLANSLMIRIANAWKMCFPRPYEASEGTHDWIKEVVGMGVMGMSASAGYETQSVVAKATCALAFASSATAFWLPRKWMTTIRVLNKVGAVACIGGILAAIGHDLPHEYKWWVAAAAFLPPAAAVVVS